MLGEIGLDVVTMHTGVVPRRDDASAQNIRKRSKIERPLKLSSERAGVGHDGTLCSVGLPDKFELSSFTLAMGRRSLASSGAGGTHVTREMLEFCGKHNIVADIEMVKPAEIAKAFERLEKADVRNRFVLDMRRD